MYQTAEYTCYKTCTSSAICACTVPSTTRGMGTDKNSVYCKTCNNPPTISGTPTSDICAANSTRIVTITTGVDDIDGDYVTIVVMDAEGEVHAGDCSSPVSGGGPVSCEFLAGAACTMDGPCTMNIYAVETDTPCEERSIATKSVTFLYDKTPPTIDDVITGPNPFYPVECGGAGFNPYTWINYTLSDSPYPQNPDCTCTNKDLTVIIEISNEADGTHRRWLTDEFDDCPDEFGDCQPYSADGEWNNLTWYGLDDADTITLEECLSKYTFTITAIDEAGNRDVFEWRPIIDENEPPTFESSVSHSPCAVNAETHLHVMVNVSDPNGDTLTLIVNNSDNSETLCKQTGITGTILETPATCSFAGGTAGCEDGSACEINVYVTDEDFTTGPEIDTFLYDDTDPQIENVSWGKNPFNAENWEITYINFTLTDSPYPKIPNCNCANDEIIVNINVQDAMTGAHLRTLEGFDWECNEYTDTHTFWHNISWDGTNDDGMTIAGDINYAFAIGAMDDAGNTDAYTSECYQCNCPDGVCDLACNENCSSCCEDCNITANVAYASDKYCHDNDCDTECCGESCAYCGTGSCESGDCCPDCGDDDDPDDPFDPIMIGHCGNLDCTPIATPIADAVYKDYLCTDPNCCGADPDCWCEKCVSEQTDCDWHDCYCHDLKVTLGTHATTGSWGTCVPYSGGVCSKDTDCDSIALACDPQSGLCYLKRFVWITPNRIAVEIGQEGILQVTVKEPMNRPGTFLLTIDPATEVKYFAKFFGDSDQIEVSLEAGEVKRIPVYFTAASGGNFELNIIVTDVSNTHIRSETNLEDGERGAASITVTTIEAEAKGGIATFVSAPGISIWQILLIAMIASVAFVAAQMRISKIKKLKTPKKKRTVKTKKTVKK